MVSAGRPGPVEEEVVEAHWSSRADAAGWKSAAG